ncbi:hypothetical protein HispidOSU_030578, partial [Sigmodon hispidus]
QRENEKSCAPQLIPRPQSAEGSVAGRGADAAGAARSRRRLVNGTRTGTRANTATLTQCQEPRAGRSRSPARAPGKVNLCAVPRACAAPVPQTGSLSAGFLGGPPAPPRRASYPGRSHCVETAVEHINPPASTSSGLRSPFLRSPRYMGVVREHSNARFRTFGLPPCAWPPSCPYEGPGATGRGRRQGHSSPSLQPSLALTGSSLSEMRRVPVESETQRRPRIQLAALFLGKAEILPEIRAPAFR